MSSRLSEASGEIPFFPRVLPGGFLGLRPRNDRKKEGKISHFVLPYGKVVLGDSRAVDEEREENLRART